MSVEHQAEFSLFQANLLTAGVRFDGARPIPTLLTPYVLSTGDYRALGDDALQVHSALEKVIASYFESPDVQRRFPELAPLSAWILATPPTGRRIRLARFDYQRGGGAPQLLETNTDCPGGVFVATRRRHCSSRVVVSPRSMRTPARWCCWHDGTVGTPGPPSGGRGRTIVG